MNLIQSLSGLTALALLAGGAQAQTLEDFESGNPNSWRMDFDGTYNGFAIPSIPATHNAAGGNPDGHISFTDLSVQMDVWYLNSPTNLDWKGNLRARGVQGVDMDVRHVQGMSPFGMHMNVVLGNDMGTPEIFDDILIWSPFDPGQYSFAGFGAAVQTGVWTSLHWDMDASSTTLPAGWTVWSYTGTNSGDDDADWNAMMQDCDYVSFTNGPPWGGFVLGTIDIDFDNLSLDIGDIGTAFCFCDGSGLAAPCGNTGAVGNGCDNSAATGGAKLTANGNPSVTSSTVVLQGTGGTPGVSAIFFQGELQAGGGNGLPFNDGFRCAEGPVKRLQVVTLDGAGSAVSSIDIPTVGVIPAAGATRSYQLWYRDPVGSPCGTFSNTSNGLEIVWIP